MYLEQRSRSLASGRVSLPRDLGETVPWDPLSATFHRELRPGGSKASVLYLAHFSNGGRTPNFYSQVICPRDIETAKIEQEERKATFHLYQTSLTE